MKKIHIITALMLAFVMLFSMQVPAMAAQNYDVWIKVNGVIVGFPDQKPFIDTDNNRTYVPVRFVAEALGAEVDWDQDNMTAIIKMSDQNILMKIGSDRPTVNGTEKILDAPAQLVNARTMVPLRFISEVLGLKVTWDGEKRVVSISDGSVNEQNLVPLIKKIYDPAKNVGLKPIVENNECIYFQTKKGTADAKEHKEQISAILKDIGYPAAADHLVAYIDFFERTPDGYDRSKVKDFGQLCLVQNMDWNGNIEIIFYVNW